MCVCDVYSDINQMYHQHVYDVYVGGTRGHSQYRLYGGMKETTETTSWVSISKVPCCIFFLLNG